jgi:hypothetical protein
MLEWKVYISDFNGKRIVTHNIFDNSSLIEDCQKNYKKNKDDPKAFFEELQRDIMYYYWSKCEWEIIITHWPPRKDAREEKIDVYDQVMLNWPQFCEYVWARKDEFKVRRKRNVKT